MARPVLEEIVAERPDLKVSKINIDEGVELAGCFGMMSIPMLTVMKNGKIVNQAVSTRTPGRICSRPHRGSSESPRR